MNHDGLLVGVRYLVYMSLGYCLYPELLYLLLCNSRTEITQLYLLTDIPSCLDTHTPKR